MKERIVKAVLFLLAALILLPCLLLLVWMFTERWAWPDLLPQKFSLRAAAEVFGRRGELFKVFFSSVLISTTVAALSSVIGVMTCRALVFYDFFGKRLMGFLTILPFMVPATVFAMGIQMTFIRMDRHPPSLLPDVTSLPNGQSANIAILNSCRPNGIPIIVMQNRIPPNI